MKSYSDSYFLSLFPSPEELKETFWKVRLPEFREANGHLHTPYSFSAFADMASLFSMARSEGISLLGINDFFVTDGYSEFYKGCLNNGIFPLFNIEFIGLLKDEQKKEIRINDPNNPGRIYFCGKGLDYPFHLSKENREKLNNSKDQTQKQLRLMVSKLNSLIADINPSIKLDFEEIKKKYAHDLVRERHLARAIRILVSENYHPKEEQQKFLQLLYGGKTPRVDITDPSGLENEIRANLMKAGGRAFVEEDESAFMALERIIEIITDAGGIPCYPVLLDDSSGNYTEYEADREKLFSSLIKYGIRCIELIPGRNNLSTLKDFVEFFDRKGFVITFGTEHNTPELKPLTVTATGSKPLDNSLKKIAWRGASVIAAHQYLRAQNKSGYTGQGGLRERKIFESLGELVLKYYFKKYST